MLIKAAVCHFWKAVNSTLASWYFAPRLSSPERSTPDFEMSDLGQSLLAVACTQNSLIIFHIEALAMQNSRFSEKMLMRLRSCAFSDFLFIGSLPLVGTVTS